MMIGKKAVNALGGSSVGTRLCKRAVAVMAILQVITLVPKRFEGPILAGKSLSAKVKGALTVRAEVVIMAESCEAPLKDNGLE
jgi:hypothetical protein